MSNKDKKQSLTNRELAYQGTFTTSQGRVVLEDMKKGLRYGENLYHAGMSPTDLAYQLGRQSVVNDIQFILNKEAK